MIFSENRLSSSSTSVIGDTSQKKRDRQAGAASWSLSLLRFAAAKSLSAVS